MNIRFPLIVTMIVCTLSSCVVFSQHNRSNYTEGLGSDSNSRIARAREVLLTKDYSLIMMNDLFGEENLYFPINLDRLETSVHIVDLLIENKQYPSDDKATLIELANNAYHLYSDKRSAAGFDSSKAE